MTRYQGVMQRASPIHLDVYLPTSIDNDDGELAMCFGESETTLSLALRVPEEIRESQSGQWYMSNEKRY